jgi:hypothetical protein
MSENKPQIKSNSFDTTSTKVDHLPISEVDPVMNSELKQYQRKYIAEYFEESLKQQILEM